MRIRIKLAPKSSDDTIIGWMGNTLKVRVSAPPQRGKANKALLVLLCDALGLPARCVRLVQGAASPNKVVEIQGLDENDIRMRLKTPVR